MVHFRALRQVQLPQQVDMFCSQKLQFLRVPRRSSISQDGIVAAVLPGESAKTELGQITIATFANPRGLTPVGENFYTATSASGEASVGAPVEGGRGKLVQSS